MVSFGNILFKRMFQRGGYIAHFRHGVQPTFHNDGRRMGGQNDLHIGIQFLGSLKSVSVAIRCAGRLPVRP